MPVTLKPKIKLTVQDIIALIEQMQEEEQKIIGERLLAMSQKDYTKRLKRGYLIMTKEDKSFYKRIAEEGMHSGESFIREYEERDVEW